MGARASLSLTVAFAMRGNETLRSRMRAALRNRLSMFALHLCGAQGYMRESAAQRFYRDCKVLELGEGTSEIQRETIFRHIGR